MSDRLYPSGWLNIGPGAVTREQLLPLSGGTLTLDPIITAEGEIRVRQNHRGQLATVVKADVPELSRHERRALAARERSKR